VLNALEAGVGWRAGQVLAGLRREVTPRLPCQIPSETTPIDEVKFIGIGHLDHDLRLLVGMRSADDTMSPEIV
jgi:hypothetical protein